MGQTGRNRKLHIREHILIIRDSNPTKSNIARPDTYWLEATPSTVRRSSPLHPSNTHKIE